MKGITMHIDSYLEKSLSKTEYEQVTLLISPVKIQAYLDETPYSSDDFYRCPRRVIQDRKAHCFDGALFAAAMLVRIGFPPLILELLPNTRDDDHLLAVYRRYGHWGAVAKSNFVGLRYREPIYKSIRELVMSYFEQYYNTAREKTLRGYTIPMNLKGFNSLNWMIKDEPLDLIANRLDEIRRFTILSKRMEKNLAFIDERSYSTGLMGSNAAGLFKPGA
jgi:hypothetical protein